MSTGGTSIDPRYARRVSVNAPPRPAALPADAVWNPDAGVWELCARGADGARQGECLTFRPDGTLFGRQHFVAGLAEGTFTTYHAGGAVARTGTAILGRVEGLVSAFAGPPGSEPLRTCCVPPAAVRMESRYEGGALLHDVFFDASGQPLQSDGRPWPARPAGVPEEASYDEPSGGWARWRPTQTAYWSAAGVLVKEVDLDRGLRCAERIYDGAGVLRESLGFDREQRRQGPYRRRFGTGEPTRYADPRIREERGAFDTGRPSGVWTFLDEAGEVLRRIDLGQAFAGSADALALADDPGAPPAAWRARAEAWRREGRVHEALCALARAAAGQRDAAGLRAALADAVVPLSPEAAAEQGERLVRAADVTVAQVLDGLVGGADARAALRALAAALPGASQAALDFAEAALLLAPGQAGAHLTRALIRFQHGDPTGAEEDLAVVAQTAPEPAVSLRATMTASFRPFAFWPAGEPLAPDPELAELGAGIIRELDEVRETVALYATRLAAVRARLQSRWPAGAAPAWLPPDLASLLGDGPRPLRHERMAPPADAEDPAPLEIDERLDPAALSVPALLAEAHADWAALCWLCWSVGLDQVGLPAAIAERPLMPVAMKTIVTRCWRAQDRVSTGGLLARANQVPGFVWHGMDIDAVPQHLARTIAEEYLRARAMFLWLASPDVVSPFQVDLRQD